MQHTWVQSCILIVCSFEFVSWQLEAQERNTGLVECSFRQYPTPFNLMKNFDFDFLLISFWETLGRTFSMVMPIQYPSFAGRLHLLLISSRRIWATVLWHEESNSSDQVVWTLAVRCWFHAKRFWAMCGWKNFNVTARCCSTICVHSPKKIWVHTLCLKSFSVIKSDVVYRVRKTIKD